MREGSQKITGASIASMLTIDTSRPAGTSGIIPLPCATMPVVMVVTLTNRLRLRAELVSIANINEVRFNHLTPVESFGGGGEVHGCVELYMLDCRTLRCSKQACDEVSMYLQQQKSWTY